MKRWAVKHDGADAGHVYADTLEAARRAARAGYKRIHPDRDPKGRVRVDKNFEPVESELVEARRLADQVYEGLRLLPGMEHPAEKLRNVVVLLETAAAKTGHGASDSGAVSGGGGDTELLEVLEPVLDAGVVPTPVKANLRGQLEWVGLNTAPEERQKVELKLFQILWQAGLIDRDFETEPSCALHRPSAFLTKRLLRHGLLEIQRFEGANDVDAFREHLRTFGKDSASLAWAFMPSRGGPDPVEVRRPLVLVRERRLQAAILMRGVQHDDEEVVAFDRALFEVLDRLRNWADGLGQLALPHFEEKQRSLFERMQKRIDTVRTQMADAARAGEPVLPPETARRDLLKFVIDQVHRIEDALSLLPGRELRDAYGELVFKDIVFRGAGPYLSKHFGINIDTEVVEGADSQGLVGRFQKEPGGPRPRSKTTKIYSVVVPCYTQDGVSIRPASVRLGSYE